MTNDKTNTSDYHFGYYAGDGDGQFEFELEQRLLEGHH
jgi:hypothetical protein